MPNAVVSVTPELQELVDARAALEEARARYLAAVLPARAKHSLAEVAVALGVSRQMAHKLTVQARSAQTAETREPTEAELRKRLAELDARWTQLVDRIAPQFEPPDPRREQLARNTHNGLVARAESGKRRDGRANGQIGYRGKRLATVAEETRRLAEREILRSLANHPEDPIVRKVEAELVEARQIRERLEALQELRSGF